MKAPIPSSWSVRILDPKQAIERLNVLLDDIPLPFSDVTNEQRFEEFVDEFGVASLRIPIGKEKDDALVKVRDGKKVLRKAKFKDIPSVN